MANFDPQVQEQPQREYAQFYFRPIQQPMPNVSEETKGKAIGGATSEIGKDVGQSLNLAQETKQEYIGANMAKDYSSVNENFVQNLAQLDDVVTGKKPDNSLLTPTSQINPNLKGLPSQVQNLAAIRDSGKVSPVYYDMLKDNIAKKYRSEFPGDRDFIDTEFMHLTWRDPANKVISALTEDINAYAGQAKEARNKLDTKVLDGVTSGDISPQTRQMWMQGKITDEAVLGQISQRNKLKNDLTIQDLEMRNLDMKNKLTTETATKNNNDALSKDLGLSINEMTLHMPEFGDDKKMGEVLNGIANGSIPKPDEQQALAIKQQVQWQKASWVSKMLASGNQVPEPTKDNPHPRSRADYMGGAAAYNNLVNEQAKQFDVLGDLFAKGDVPLATAHKQFIEAAGDDAAANLIKDNPWIPSAAAGTKIFGANAKFAADWFTDFTTDPNVVKTLKPWSTQTASRLISQPDMQGTANTYFTLGQALTEAKNKGVTKNADGVAAVNKVIERTTHTIINPQAPPEARKNAAEATYGDPDLIALVNSSQMKPDGTVTPGDSTLLAQVVNNKTTQEIKHLGDPVLFQKYVQSSTNYIQTVFKNAIDTLNAHEHDPGVEYGWDNQNHNWTAQYKGQQPNMNDWLQYGTQDLLRPFTGATDQYAGYKAMPYINASVKKLNMAIESAKSIADATGQDSNAFVARMLLGAGLDPNSDNGKTSQGLLKSLAASNAQPEQPVP